MSDFKIIETQEQFDAAISERLKRDRETQAKKYEGWISPEEQQKALDELNKKIKALEDAATVSERTIAEKDAVKIIWAIGLLFGLMGIIVALIMPGVLENEDRACCRLEDRICRQTEGRKRG